MDETGGDESPAGALTENTWFMSPANRTGAGVRTATDIAPVACDGIRRQESVFILLNLSILAALAGIHVLFASHLGRPSASIVSLLAVRFVWQALELIWLRKLKRPFRPKAARAYATVTVLLHLTFAIVASMVSGLKHSHYVVLLVLPTIAAAFRFGWLGTVTVAAIAGASTLLEVRVHYERFSVQGRVTELFEATTVVLVYAAVAAFVHLVARQLRAKQRSLENSLDALATARDQLVEREKLAAVGRLSAAVAHEMRNPIAAIAAAVATAKRNEFMRPVLDEMCQVIEHESARLTRLSTEFLSYARQKAPECKSTSVRTTLEYVQSLSRPLAEDREVTVEVKTEGDFEAEFDPFQVHQALLNLATNAVEAAGPGGRVTLSAQPLETTGVRFSVRNTGEVVPPEALTHMFEPFFTTKPEGTGLGLAISAKIATAHDGSLRLAANEPGSVEFELRLPGRAAANEKRA